MGRALAGLTRGERVADVADEVGYSRRRLSTLVRQETGLAPKEYQRVARFQASRAVLGRRPLGEVAVECGYADQGHLAREWAELAGCPPTTWLREEFPFLQDLGWPRRQADRMTAADTRLWHTMAFADAGRMIEWLKAVGFTEHATYRDENDPSVVVHAEWLWPGGGGIMFGSRRPDGAVDNVGARRPTWSPTTRTASSSAPCAAGASVERELVDQDYGGRGGSVADPEGNHWSFGDYQPS